MTIGPVQLLVLGFDHPDFKGEILAEFDRLKDSDVVRIIDGIAVRKDRDGEVSVIKRSDLWITRDCRSPCLLHGN